MITDRAAGGLRRAAGGRVTAAMRRETVAPSPQDTSLEDTPIAASVGQRGGEIRLR